ncbi:MAG TPA: HAD family hydrolase [Clostridiales bacterium]|nr:HAD family hydrolase [Clostridiales bacterium]
MIRAVVFDMFETLVTLFEGRTYFGEDIAADVGADPEAFRKEWHAIEHDRSIGTYTIEEGLAVVFKKLGIYSEEHVKKAASGRWEALGDTFSAIPQESLDLLKGLKEKGFKIGLITNTFSDERDYIRRSPLFPYFDVALISYEQGICKPAPEMYRKMIKELGVRAEECLYVGDGGSRELYAAREAGMQPVQCTWFHERAFEPHIPCPILEEFKHAEHPAQILEYACRTEPGG